MLKSLLYSSTQKKSEYEYEYKATGSSTSTLKFKIAEYEYEYSKICTRVQMYSSTKVLFPALLGIPVYFGKL